jgi:uridine kinase
MGQITHVVKRSGAIVPFNPDRIMNAIYRAAVAVGGRDRERARWLTQQVVELLERTTPQGHTPHIEEIQDIVEKVLIENAHAKVAKAYILYREERAHHRQAVSRSAAQPSENIPWAKIYHVLDWAVSHAVHTVEALNTRIGRGEFPDIVHESETAYEQEIATAAELIADDATRTMVIISGPSSSGKRDNQA